MLLDLGEMWCHTSSFAGDRKPLVVQCLLITMTPAVEQYNTMEMSLLVVNFTNRSRQV